MGYLFLIAVGGVLGGVTGWVRALEKSRRRLQELRALLSENGVMFLTGKGDLLGRLETGEDSEFVIGVYETKDPPNYSGDHAWSTWEPCHTYEVDVDRGIVSVPFASRRPQNYYWTLATWDKHRRDDSQVVEVPILGDTEEIAAWLENPSRLPGQQSQLALLAFEAMVRDYRRREERYAALGWFMVGAFFGFVLAAIIADWAS